MQNMMQEIFNSITGGCEIRPRSIEISYDMSRHINIIEHNKSCNLKNLITNSISLYLITFS